MARLVVFLYNHLMSDDFLLSLCLKKAIPCQVNGLTGDRFQDFISAIRGKNFPVITDFQVQAATCLTSAQGQALICPIYFP
jgi:hypothetical protein